MEKGNRDDRVSFSFKNIINSEIVYEAFYAPPSRQWDETEHWLGITEKPKMFPHYHRDKAWKIFLDNATFEDILCSAKGFNIYDVIHQEGTPDFNDGRKWTDKKFFEELAIHPDWLAFPKTGALNRLIFLIRVAGEANSKKADQTAKNMKDYLIPKRPGGVKSYPVNLYGCYYLLNRLAKHISNSCKSFIKDNNFYVNCKIRSTSNTKSGKDRTPNPVISEQ
jgi:hypothetical protein